MLNELILKEKIEHITSQFEDCYEFFEGKKVSRKLSGDVYENELREAISEFFSGFGVGSGMVYKDAESKSKEMDIIIYSGDPLFKSGSLVVVSPEVVKAVIQVKGYIPNPKKDFENIISNIESAANLNPNMKRFCFTVIANAKKSFPKHRKILLENKINLFALWDMPGSNKKVIDGSEGSIKEFFIELDKILS